MLKNKRGETYVTVCVLILILVTVFSVIFTYASVITEVRLQKTNARIVFDSFVANNSIRIYGNIKRGSNAMRGVDVVSFNSSLIDFCSLDFRDSMLYCVDADGGLRYRMTVPSVGYTEDGHLELYAAFTMYVPIRFAGVTVSTAEVPVRITSALESKYESEGSMTP